jgi:hypothetical protein
MTRLLLLPSPNELYSNIQLLLCKLRDHPVVLLLRCRPDGGSSCCCCC